MIVYCTICCRKKRLDFEKIKAIKRYISGRIIKVYQKSRIDRVDFRIFSGKFGLLNPGKKIFWYDEKLSEKQIPEISELLKKQLLKEKITQIVFFAYNPEKNRGWIPYITVLKMACKMANAELKIRYL